MFSRLTYEDKQAFFELLDEYFESRPHLLSRGTNHTESSPASQPAAIATAAVHRTMASNPQATADLISSGLKSIPKTSQYGAASNPIVANAAGQFAASSITSSYNSGNPAQAKSPPAPPRRNMNNTDDSPSPGQASPSGGSRASGGLLASRRLGDVDTSSISAAISSSFRGGKPAPAPASVNLPPALGAPKRNFAPPPVRRVPTNASSEGDAGDRESKVQRSPSNNPPPIRRTPEPQAAHGEPAEALYDYTSEAAEDISIRQGEKLTIVKRDSDDWWTGEINGQRGLVPASYVRIL